MARIGLAVVVRFLKIVVLVLVVAAAGLAGYLYHFATKLDHRSLTDDAHVIFGFGGNVGVLATGAGTVLIDTMTFPLQGERIKALAEKLTGEPVRVVVNTHYHQDHTHGNPAFDGDTRIVATEATRRHMLERDGGFWEGDHTRSLPNDTFPAANGVHEHEIAIGDKTVRLLHLGRGHTDGDLVAVFVEDGVLHTGDLVFNQRYPNIDLEAGGSIPLWIETLERVRDLEFEQVIPGHGAVTDDDGIVDFRRFLEQLWETAEDAVSSGQTLEQYRTDNEFDLDEGYGEFRVPFVITLDRDFVLGRAYENACPGTVTAGTCTANGG